MKKKKLPMIAKLEIIGAVVFIGIVLLSFTPGLNISDITGHASLEVYKQDLDITISESQVYDFESNSEAPFLITSIKFSGEVIGEGRVEISLVDANGEVLAYKNVREDREGISAITGFSSKEGSGEDNIAAIDGSWLLLKPRGKYSGGWSDKLYEKEEIMSGTFENACIETCYISMTMSNDLSYKIIFKVDSGTELHINNIIYTISE